MKKGVLFLFTITIHQLLFAQAPSVKWIQNYGSEIQDEIASFTPTADGGYLLSGTITSATGDVKESIGGDDIWVLKLDSQGDTLWTRIYGGTGTETAEKVIETETPGEYLVAAQVQNSNDFIAKPTFGQRDIVILKIDDNGDTLWSLPMGGTDQDYFSDMAVIEEFDGYSYLFAGSSRSSDGYLSGNEAFSTGWLVKISTDGDTLWSTHHADNNFISITMGYDKVVTLAGAFYTSEKGQDATIYILKKSTGEIDNSFSYGGTNNESAYDLVQFDVNKFLFTGSCDGKEGLVKDELGGRDMWIVAVDLATDTLWTHVLGTADNDFGREILYDESQGVYYVVGTYGSAQDSDFDIPLIAAIHKSGDTLWTETYGSLTGEETFGGSVLNDDGSISLAFDSRMTDGDVVATNGSFDLHVLTLGAVTTAITDYSISNEIYVYPSPGKNTLFVEGMDNDIHYSIYNNMGQLMIREASASNATIDISSLSNGQYILLFDNGVSMKFLKQ